MTFEPVVRNVKNTGLPFFFRLTSLAILIEGILGLILFFAVLGYSVFNKTFLFKWGYDAFAGTSIFVMLILQLVLYSGLTFSGAQLLRRKKSGFYLFTLSYLLLAGTNYFIQNEFSMTGVVIGIIVWLILLLNYKILD